MQKVDTAQTSRHSSRKQAQPKVADKIQGHMPSMSSYVLTDVVSRARTLEILGKQAGGDARNHHGHTSFVLQ